MQLKYQYHILLNFYSPSHLIAPFHVHLKQECTIKNFFISAYEHVVFHAASCSFGGNSLQPLSKWSTIQFSASFLLSSPIFEKFEIKIARKYKSFWHATKYPQKFLRKTPIWGYRFCRFFSTKKLVEIDEFRIAFTPFADF